jgi:outer membrane biosynthesis protein TonB
MARWSIPLVAFMCFGAFAVAQQPDPEQPLSSDLVQWSYMQQPQQPEQGAPRQTPTPEPSPETQPAQNPTPPSHPSQPGQPENAPAAGSQAQSPTAQTFTGIISKEADSFTLKVSEATSYKLDNQQEVQQYEGKRVRVTGTLESSVNLIHVDKIEPIS